MKRNLTGKQKQELLGILKVRFDKNINRHKDVSWDKVISKLEAHSTKLWSLNEMEISGGEPALFAYDKPTDIFLFYDCSAETPKDRRSICYDHNALESRKENKPKNSACKMAEDMGIEILTEEEYRALQKLGIFDTKTSSWVKTPDSIRKLGGALFCDRRYNNIFVYHNGAESYYAARGFRGSLKV